MKLLKAIFIVLLFLLYNNLYSDTKLKNYIDNSYLTGSKEKELDTLHMRTAKEIADETVGLLEKEIDPDKYIMGPNDGLYISIVTTETQEHKVTVSPDGNVLVPGIGIVNVKDKTLTEAIKIIENKVDEIYRTYKVFVSLIKLKKFKVIVSGSIKKPAIVTATGADRCSEAIERAGGLKYDASVRNIVLIRDNKTIIPVDLMKFNVGYKSANPFLRGGDQIIISPSNQDNSIEIWGQVYLEGIFEFSPGDSLSTLIRFARGFLESADLDSVEINRFEENNAKIRKIFLDLNSWKDSINYFKPLPNDIPLEIGDRVFIRPKTNWQDKRRVIIEGEINLPGKYAINKNQVRVYDILVKAGGFTDEASIDGSILTRQKEIEKIDREMKRLESIPPSEMSENETRYYQARKSEQKGVMAINFKRIWNDPSSLDNIILIDQDSIFVPTKKNFINVQGRVNNPGLVLFKPENNYLDYIQQAGGFGFRADEDETLIVKQKGEQFLAEDMNYTLEPGDNILVPPLSEDKINWWLWTTQVITMLGMLSAILSTIITIRNQ